MRINQACLVLAAAVTSLALMTIPLGCASSDSGAQEPGDIAASTETPAESTTTTTLSRAQLTLDDMTLREKAAQVLLVTFSGTQLSEKTSALLAAGPPGGLLILGHNVTDAAQMQVFTSALQRTAAATGSPVGLFIAVDQEGGTVQRIKQGVPELPSARKMGTESTPSKAYFFAIETARGLRAQGINMNLAPVADVVADESSFLYSRTYSGDPVLVSEFVTAVIEAHHEQGIIAVVKHFPGHGSASGNTHTEGAVSGASKQDFETVHLVPFRAAMSAGVEAVMAAHIVAAPYDPANPASLSGVVINDLLRSELGFEGLVIADDVSMAAALDRATPDPATLATMSNASDQVADQASQAEEPTEERILVAKEVGALVAALNAGCDLLILTELETRAQAVLDGLVAAVQQGEISQARLDEAVLRILELKYRYDIVAIDITQSTTTLVQEDGS